MSGLEITRDYSVFGSNDFTIKFKDVLGGDSYLRVWEDCDNIIETNDYDLCCIALSRVEEVNKILKKKAGRLGSK